MIYLFSRFSFLSSLSLQGYFIFHSTENVQAIQNQPFHRMMIKIIKTGCWFMDFNKTKLQLKPIPSSKYPGLVIYMTDARSLLNGMPPVRICHKDNILIMFSKNRGPKFNKFFDHAHNIFDEHFLSTFASSDQNNVHLLRSSVKIKIYFQICPNMSHYYLFASLPLFSLPHTLPPLSL